ncbi:MAG: sulfite exporter TauE/SafE family protein, partial [Crocinitomicaceae bacterium]|nr:sulfite exporter TauE/SafE family protein [Crocinitomicaceae bacterium]
MEYVIVAITVLFGAGLTFFSGFGLGTLMLPVFSLFFELPIAVGATAIVHLANNSFKFILVSKHIHFPTLLRFGLPALLFAFIGSILLTSLDHSEPLYTYQLNKHNFELTLVKMTIGSLMMFFAWFDLDPRFDNLNIEKKHIYFGGMLSGFFGGLSGHQGAFRAAFLAKSGLTKEQFIGTS